MPVRIRNFEAGDIPFGMRLKDQNGWNQIEADWKRALALQPDGCFLAERDGEPVGTAASCILGPVAWIAMMLVAEPVRRQGIGRALMTHALGFLERAGVPTIRLDATPLGRPLYESLGFLEDATFLRYQGAPIPPGSVPELPLVEPGDRDPILALDRHATGADRRKLIDRLVADNPGLARTCRAAGSIAGFALARPGSWATQIGPCIADEAAGPTLLRDAFGRHAGQLVIIDIPESHQPARALAEAAGLTTVRTLSRMTRGARIAEHLNRIWASSGPEMG